MPEKVELYEIMPFTEIFYRTCRFNPLLSAVYYYGGSVEPFLANDILTYAYNETDIGFRLINGVLESRSWMEILHEMGMKMDHHFLSDDILTEIKDSIRNNTVVYTTIDRCYWHSHRNNGFIDKIHWSHYIVIIGFDDAEGKFTIIDSDVERSSKETILYEDFKKGFEAGKVWQRELFYVKPFKLNKNDEERPAGLDYALLYLKNLLGRKEKVYEGLENIKKAEAYYRNILNEDPSILLNQQIENVARSFLYMDQSKRVELYRIRKFFDADPKLSAVIIKIINTIGIMRGIYMRTLKIRKDVAGCTQALIDQLKRIYDLEMEYYAMFFQSEPVQRKLKLDASVGVSGI